MRSDEGLTLETSAPESLYGGQFTLSTQLIKPNYLVILPPTQHHSLFRNLPPSSFVVYSVHVVKQPISLPFYIPQLVKSLPFYIPKRYPFRAEPPRIGSTPLRVIDPRGISVTCNMKSRLAIKFPSLYEW